MWTCAATLRDSREIAALLFVQVLPEIPEDETCWSDLFFLSSSFFADPK